MEGIGNMPQIEMSYMNSMIAFIRAYQNNSKLIGIRPLQESIRYSEPTVFIPKSEIRSITKINSCYILTTKYD